MGKNMKQRLRDQKKEKEVQNRDQIIQDVREELNTWSSKTEQLLKDQRRSLHKMKEAVDVSARLIKTTNQNTVAIRFGVKRKIKRYKKFLSWKFYAACYLAGLLGGLTAVTLCGLYWPTIRRILG